MRQHLVRNDLGARRGVEANADAIDAERTAHYCRSLALALVYLRREELYKRRTRHGRSPT